MKRLTRTLDSTSALSNGAILNREIITTTTPRTVNSVVWETTISILIPWELKQKIEPLFNLSWEDDSDFWCCVCALSNDSESIMGTHLWGYKQMSAGSQIPESVNEGLTVVHVVKNDLHTGFSPCSRKGKHQALFQTKWIQISQVKIMFFIFYFEFFLGGSEVQEGWEHHVLWLHSISLEAPFVCVNK